MMTPRLTFLLIAAALLAPAAAQAGHPTSVTTPARPRIPLGAPAMVRNRPRAPVAIGGPSKSKASHTAVIDGTDAAHRHLGHPHG